MIQWSKRPLDQLWRLIYIWLLWTKVKLFVAPLTASLLVHSWSWIHSRWWTSELPCLQPNKCLRDHGEGSSFDQPALGQLCWCIIFHSLGFLLGTLRHGIRTSSGSMRFCPYSEQVVLQHGLDLVEYTVWGRGGNIHHSGYGKLSFPKVVCLFFVARR